MQNILAETKNQWQKARQSLLEAERNPSGAPWDRWLFWSFWLSLATFPVGYGAREVLPVICFIFLLFYYRYNWSKSVLRRLDARPLFYCLWAMWIDDPEMFYVLGSAVGPHPYPYMVRVFQSVVGREARAQMLAETGRLPSACLACVGGGSNAIGLFAGFLDDADVRLLGVEPGGRGNSYGQHAASLCLGEPGVMHGFNSYMRAAGVDDLCKIPGIGPAKAALLREKLRGLS